MAPLDPEFSITSLEARREVHFSAKGLWTMETIKAFETSMIKTLGPIIQTGQPLRFLSDLRGLVPQNRAIAAEIERLIEHSLQLGNERTALVADTKLTLIQHRRLNGGNNIQFFECRTQALTWLRS